MIESVPNLSEGRDKAVIGDLSRVACASGARVLDVHSDSDHNRSVLTLVGTAPQLKRAAADLAHEAVKRIDLRAHRGVHPRVGALDVVPFVPLEGSTMEDSVALAREAGEEIARRTQIPVFLYGRAASRSERVSLASIRRGGLEGLRGRIGRDGWVPDFGPQKLHPSAGAVAVGAREPLVAFNVMLDTADLGLGQEIAAATRARNGGPAGVQALAFEVRGRVQISMNLTDVEATPVAVAFTWVRDLAAARGVGIFASEIVGLAPRRSLVGATASALRLEGRLEDRILERRLESL